MLEFNFYEFIKYAAFINFGLYILSAVIIVAFQNQIASLHSKMFGVENNNSLKLLYFNVIGIYKILVIVFFVVPYIAMYLISN